MRNRATGGCASVGAAAITASRSPYVRTVSRRRSETATPQRASSTSASSTRSRESAARSSGSETSGVISSTPTPSWSATTRRTCASYVASMIIVEKDAGRETPWGDEAGTPPRVAHACDLSAGVTRTVRAFDARPRRRLHSDILRQVVAQHADHLDGDDEPGREDE